MAGGGNPLKRGGGYITYFGVSGKCVTNQKMFNAPDELISEEIRCEYKSAYKTTINYYIVILLCSWSAEFPYLYRFIKKS